MVDAACAQVEIELNSAADSPLVLPEEGAMLSNGNFHVPALALALDAAAIALAQAASMRTFFIGKRAGLGAAAKTHFRVAA